MMSWLVKILYVHERFGAFGGAESNIAQTAREFTRRGHELALLHGPGTGKSEEAWRGLFPRRFVLEGQPGPEVTRALGDFNPDIIYVHKMADLRVLENLLASGRPAVRMVHDHEMYCMRNYKYNVLTRAICHKPAGLHCLFPCGAFLARQREGRLPVRWVSYSVKRKEIALNRRFHRLFAVSRYMRQELLANGFDAARIGLFAPAPPQPESFSNDHAAGRRDNLIIFAGQVIRGKGVDLLLRSLALLRVPFECLILGEGSHRPACERLAGQLKLGARVRFMGFVPQNELRRHYATGAVFAFSSVWPEPFGTAGLEAMHQGLPVVAFDVGGVSDWLFHESTGFLVPARDCRRFAARLELLISDPVRARAMGERGREIARSQFDFAAGVQNLEVAFTDLLKHA